jgi:glycosyltransferase involved in cell wall biosynthesis
MATAALRNEFLTPFSTDAMPDSRVPGAASGDRVKLLAVSYMLPPFLYPQGIQIGRLLAHLPAEIGVVCGEPRTGEAAGGLYPDFNRKLAFRKNVAFQPRLSGAMGTLARRIVPFYGRVPDEFRPWVPLADAAVAAKLHDSGFRPSLLITFGEPMSDHLLGLRLKAKLGVPWIAHFSDPWANNPFRRHEFLAKLVNRYLERKVIADADRLVFTSEETLDLVMRRYPSPWRSKATVLSHSFDPALYPPRARPQGPIIVRYLGNFYGHRSPIPLFRAIKLLLARNPQILRGVEFELIGQMPARMRLHPSIRSLPDGLVRLRNTVSYTESLRLMSNSDLLLVIDGPDDLSVFLPSKLIDYLGARVPILGIVPPGTSAKLLARLGAPIADPSKSEEVASALQFALDQAVGRRAAPNWQPWGDTTIIDEFDIENVSAAFFQLAQNTAQRFYRVS